MRIDGWLLDVRFEGDEAVLWVRDPERGRVELRDRYTPGFYAEPLGMTAGRLRDILEEHDLVAGVGLDNRRSSIREMEETAVVWIRVDEVKNYRLLQEEVGGMPCVATTYDTDLEHELKYLCDRALIPLSRVEIEAEDGMVRSIIPVPRSLRVEPPPLRLLCFALKIWGSQGEVLTFDENLEEGYTFTGPVKQVLRDFWDHFADLDPDIVACREKDLEKLLTHPGDYRRFGRVTGDGPVLYGGRAHVSLSTYGRLSLAGLVERVQYTRLPARLSAEWAAGRAIESRQCYEARRRGVLLLQRGGFQPVMTMRELLQRDSGGLIFTPEVGLHDNVASLDFESMFPNLIVRRNISYENVRDLRGREGFIVDFTRETLDRRLHFKHLRYGLPKDSQEWRWCEGRQLALKEILFCTYGYSGCWANRFGNFDTFTEINRQARDALVKSMNHARRRGYHTIYGNNDSLFLKRRGATREDYEALAAEIADHVGLPMAVEAHFRFLVLLPQKGEERIGAINRYYGRLADGGYKHRGIELRRRDTPPYAARVQREAIEALLGCESMEAVRTEGLNRALKVLEEACRRLRDRAVPVGELKTSTVLRQDPERYKAWLPHVAAAKALALTGATVEAGSSIDYVYVDADHGNPFRRVRPAGRGGGYDVEKYAQLVREAGRSILMPFGVDPRRVRGPRVTRLSDWWPEGVP
ncbi:MAG: DNA polymerase domain-containing protein [Candidatus Bathyarchaeota archaeon]